MKRDEPVFQSTAEPLSRPRIAAPEPGLTPEMVIARATALKPLLRAQQDEADARGHYSQALHDEFIKAGFYRLLQPKMFGGYEFDYATYFKVIIEIASGHPATGWCLGLAASHGPLIAAHWSEEAQVELFGDGHFAAPHRAVPGGRCEPVEGGYIMDGVWPYCSGIPHSTHLLAATLIPRPDGPPRMLNFVVPAGQYTVLDDWGGDRTLGMRASGSNSVRVEKLFVPQHMTADADHQYHLRDPQGGTHGTRLHGNPMYLGLTMAPYHAALVSPVIGAARAALDEFHDTLRTQNTQIPPFVKRFESPDFQRPYGAAIAMTDAAEGIVMQAMHQHMALCRRWAEQKIVPSGEEMLRLWTMQQQAGKLACEAIEMLFRTAGSTAARSGSRMLRYFGDAQMYRGHMSSQYQTFASFVGRARLGLPSGFLDV